MATQLLAHPAVTEWTRRPQGSVVVLERMARGGGAIRWYFLTDPRDMADMASQLRPGSRVSLYFDGYLHRDTTGERVRGRMYEQMTIRGELVLGYPSSDAVEMRTDLVTGEAELTEVIVSEGLDRPDSHRLLVWGPWPAPDDDGTRVITICLVDRDGQLHAHPH